MSRLASKHTALLNIWPITVGNTICDIRCACVLADGKTNLSGLVGLHSVTTVFCLAPFRAEHNCTDAAARTHKLCQPIGRRESSDTAVSQSQSTPKWNTWRHCTDTHVVPHSRFLAIERLVLGSCLVNKLL